MRSVSYKLNRDTAWSHPFPRHQIAYNKRNKSNNQPVGNKTESLKILFDNVAQGEHVQYIRVFMFHVVIIHIADMVYTC